MAESSGVTVRNLQCDKNLKASINSHLDLLKEIIEKSYYVDPILIQMLQAFNEARKLYLKHEDLVIFNQFWDNITRVLQNPSLVDECKQNVQTLLKNENFYQQKTVEFTLFAAAAITSIASIAILTSAAAPLSVAILVVGGLLCLAGLAFLLLGFKASAKHNNEPKEKLRTSANTFFQKIKIKNFLLVAKEQIQDQAQSGTQYK